LKPFEDYKGEVLLAYQKKKEERSLSHDLLNHTPASLKRECINVFPSRYCEKDKETFKSLFGLADSKEEYYQKIRAADPDIFRPLNYFLRGRILKTHERNIYLLAWLIDFEDEHVEIPDIEPLVQPPFRLITRIITWLQNIVRNRRATYLITLALLWGLILLFNMTKPRYMYWNGNEYKTLAFYQAIDGRVIIKLDTARLANLKKITNLSQITHSDIGKVHCSKVKLKPEFFYTIGGENPEDTTKRLMPMTKEIYEKYIHKKASLVTSLQ